ncbi:MAG: NotI family restriction endonuclease [Candidatus Zixiibacteriota bacterium]
MRTDKKTKKIVRRFGIGEWYGRSYVELSEAERKKLAQLQLKVKSQRALQSCPPRGGASCTKDGGVCSIRLYELDSTSGVVHVPTGSDGELRTTCPHRFLEEGMVFSIVGEMILGNPNPVLVKEVGFLERIPGDPSSDTSESDDVGRIDMILVDPHAEPLRWCAMEIQAVYFSGSSMRSEFAALTKVHKHDLPFPAANRRPDYRSSGPKRLMPQLQIKVPALRRWGKKMAVVVDSSFFKAMGPMDRVADISNADIAWIVMRFDEDVRGAKLKLDSVHYCTLERAVEGLTGGTAVSLTEFEKRIRQKIDRQQAAS